MTLGAYLLQADYLDYYLERISVKWANFFGVFSRLALLIFLALIFCSFILWLIIPLVELRKNAMLKQIYDQMRQTHDLLYSIKEQLREIQKRGWD